MIYINLNIMKQQTGLYNAHMTTQIDMLSTNINSTTHLLYLQGSSCC